MRRPGPRRERAEPAAAGGGEGGWIVGRHEVAELLGGLAGAEGSLPASAGRSVERVLVADDPATWRWWLSGPADLARQVGAVVARCPRAALDRVADGAVHQGVAARVAARAFLEPEDLVAAAPAPALLLLVDGLEDPRNLGALIRTAAAAGAGGLLLPERRNAGLSPATAKAAAGALERLPVARVKNAARGLELLASAGVWTLGLVPGARDLWSGVDLCRPTCLVVGAEGAGLSRLVRERCDDLAGIPMAGEADSLNAAVAASVALYEAVRQRRAPPAARR